MKKVNIFWFRRDLRLVDNIGLNRALESGLPVIPLFIFDDYILEGLPRSDARFSFIYETLSSIHKDLKRLGSSLNTYKGKPLDAWGQIESEFDIDTVFTNRDYEPYAIKRDAEIETFLNKKGISFETFKDQVIFEKDEIVKKDGKPFTIYTPYKNKWLEHFGKLSIQVPTNTQDNNFLRFPAEFPAIEDLGFEKSKIEVNPFDSSVLKNYAEQRDIPRIRTSDIGPHLRFGTLSVRQVIADLSVADEVYLSELIWREFFMQILYHFPESVSENFKSKYDHIEWRNDEEEFEKWCKGETGYPIVDAGMRQLNQTGYMHNRVRMIVASFLCKHLLIDWRWGEAYFAEKLLDYELSSNVGNWQWVAGTGCDAAPYFRIFNPITQQQKFDPDSAYVLKYVPELNSSAYPSPMVDHSFAYKRALDTYKIGLSEVN